jgi:hypothetical protein
MNAIDDASEASEDESIIILSQVHEEIVLTQDAARKTINFDLVLLDSQSTVNLFTNSDHVRNIRPATTPINVHCNKGTLTTTHDRECSFPLLSWSQIQSNLRQHGSGRGFPGTHQKRRR